MKNLKGTLFGVCMLFSIPSVAGGSLDLAVSQHSVRLEHDATRVDSGAHFSIGALYNEQYDRYLLSSSFNVVDQTAVNNELIGGVGVKGFVYNAYATAFALGLGGFLRYQPTVLKGVGVEMMYYYAPSILSFNETKDFHEFIARINYRVHPQARIFLGWSDVGANYLESGYQSLDESANFGIRLNY